MNSVFGLFLCTLILHVNCRIIQLPNGIFNGTVAKTSKGRVYHKFFGIPYAKPPVGELRFKDPVPVDWCSDVITDAFQPPPKCMQPLKLFGYGSESIGQEDCLFINVFVPDDLFKPSRKAPVMIGIHGGAYKTGFGMQYGPEYFMDYDVIFVNMNYRLGVIGFLGLNNDVISGNFGMKDQVLSLRWVQQNIAKFGGDPDNVTLVAESAGAAYIHLHMFSPLSKGLFGKAIMMSGNGFAEWAHYDDGFGEAIATAFLVISGCVRKDPVEVLKCLQRVPAKELIALESHFHRSQAVPNILFKPMVESKVKFQPFMTQKPSNMSYQSYVPWITGITSGEGALRVLWDVPEKVDKKTIMGRIDQYVFTSEPENIDDLVQKIIDHYFGNEEMRIEEMMLKFVNLSTDAEFLYPFVKTVLSGSRQQYVYLYDHRGSHSVQDYHNFSIELGVSHSDDLPMVFYEDRFEPKFTPQDFKISETVMKFYTNFAIYGDPNGHSEKKIWKPLETDDIEYLHIKTDSLVMEKKSLKERYDFWESLPWPKN